MGSTGQGQPGASSDGGPSSSSSLPPFRVLFIGAGGIVFGNDWVPWNHSSHLEQNLGRRLHVVGIVEPSRERYSWVMEQKRASLAAGCYSEMRNFASVQEAAAAEREGGLGGPIDLIMLAAPPEFRGRTEAGRDLEMQLVAAFGPGPAIFTEKPVTTGPSADAYEVAGRLKASGNLVGVGYMLRYLRVVQKAMAIIRKNRLVVMFVSARYVNAYSRNRKQEWWDKERQGGPIVEQATHFCDLCRYLGGEVVMDTVRATALEHDEPAGKLGHFTDAIDEGKILPENRIPRATTAFWKFESGGLGNLSHIVALHGITYSNEITVIGDGYQMRLVDLYVEPKLFVRYPDNEREVEYHYPGDDPFYNELAAICAAQDKKTHPSSAASSKAPALKHPAGGGIGAEEAGAAIPPTALAAAAAAAAEGEGEDPLLPERILSSFEDATKSYELSWRVRLESEKKSGER